MRDEANPHSSFILHPSSFDLYTSACFEPTIDYCVIKIPRFTFEKFPDADPVLTTQMKSVGEAMAIGRTFKEALQKGIRSMEIKRFGFGLDKNDHWLKSRQSRGTGFQPVTDAKHPQNHGLETHATEEWPIAEQMLRSKLAVPTADRLWYVRYALKMGWTIDQVHQLTKYDPWFIGQMLELVEFERNASATLYANLVDRADRVNAGGVIGKDVIFHPGTAPELRQLKQLGYSDVQLGAASGLKPADVRAVREVLGVHPVYKLVDTCAAEFEAATPYYYSTYESPVTHLPLPYAGGGGGEGQSSGETLEARAESPGSSAAPSLALPRVRGREPDAPRRLL